MVVEEGREAHTINMCQQCVNGKMAQQGKQPLKIVAMERSTGEGRRIVEGYGR